jgi:hypothetical protein
MIVQQAGRSYSVRQIEELKAALAHELAQLTPEERQALELLLADQQLRSQGKLTPGVPSLLETVERIEWRETPVDMRTFVFDEYYLGKTCDGLYEVHFRDMQELFDRGGYHEAIWTGAIGTGKSFSASIGMCRILYELSIMVDPHGAFKIARNSPIHLVCFSVTEDLAVKVAFDNIIEKIQASPYFNEKFPFKKGKKEFKFPKKISLAARATTDTSALGMNVIAAFLDEGNFLPKPGKAMKAAGEKDKGEKIYNQLKRRMKSRFERRGKLPGMMFVVSSKMRTDDFTDKLIRKSKGDRTVFVRDYSLWDVKPENYSKIRFWVFIGNETLPSKVLEPAELEEYQRITRENDDTVLIDVPEDFRVDFERDLEASIRDIAGISTVNVTPFIQRRDRIKAAADYGEKHGLFHPFSVLDYTPGRQKGEFLWSRMTEWVQRPTVEGGYETLERPILNPEAPRHIHIDPSLTGDATGFVMAHIAGYKEVVRRDDQKREFAELAPVFVVDIAMGILPPLGDEILLGDVRALVYQLQDHGYPIVFLSQDGHQSADTLQQMPQRGIAADRVSVDIKPDAYEALKTALYEGRVIYYNNPRLLRELAHLEKNHMTGKVDHPPQGSKDVADALAGVVFTLSQKQPQRRAHLPMIRGLSYTPTLGSQLPMQPPPMDPAARVEVPAPRPAVVSRAPLGMVSGEEDDGWQEAQ